MARQQKLKVYRTPIGFHDAYVAAPSQKAALAAWGSDADLFARGAAERVTDEALTREPLARPGTVIRRARGSNAEHIAALAQTAPPRPRRAASSRDEEDEGPRPRSRRKAADPKPAAKPKPRPSRAGVDDAERALERLRGEQDEALADLRRREKDLQAERRALERRQQEEIERREVALERARADYDAATAQWRA